MRAKDKKGRCLSYRVIRLHLLVFYYSIGLITGYLSTVTDSSVLMTVVYTMFTTLFMYISTLVFRLWWYISQLGSHPPLFSTLWDGSADWVSAGWRPWLLQLSHISNVNVLQHDNVGWGSCSEGYKAQDWTILRPNCIKEEEINSV